MNLLKQFWNWFITPKADACCEINHEPTPVEVEEVEDEMTAGEILEALLLSVGVEEGYLKSRIAPAHAKWYTGNNTEEEVRNSLSDFLASHKGISRNIKTNVEAL